ncbi:Aspercryptin biosynthesis cluster-specific transcription regulator atnN [Colletotrichum aenigma]|uniref:Aspercryptin biosynthesis cluster-specific transcription regulator atnN n=1 Tax=Colletotrichum aenigma TaxID=1215731 RepID=UPI0018725A71|nr:Aspercryptin biosynthesis cluster-specific transcription regulator atnN [Colletotrichum aenigma]KAF5527908.1 Aspercryptin biosynthesis cluster-specific transcription regulator atnN [Colletotrichum aenigma]
MTKVKRGQRKRAWAPKSRNGCAVCKSQSMSISQRRIKCDEKLPCANCLNAGFDCHRSSPSDTQDAVVPKHHEVPIRRNPSPLNPLALNEREGRAYRFFQIIGAPALSSGFECEFWGRLVLQLANAYDAIFHATVALGLLLEDMHNWPISWPVPRQAPPTERTANALRHYQTALQQLFVPVVGKESANAISLASAVVFACIETLCGDARNAMKLISSGISILTQLEASISSLANLESFAPFVSVFVRLDSYMRELLQTEHHVRPKPPVFRHLRPCPPVFGSLREANRQLEILENLCLFVVEQQDTPREVQSMPTRTSCQSMYQDWLEAFNASSISTNDENSHALLHIRRLDLYLTLHGPEDTCPQSGWDYFLPEFIEMLTYGASASRWQHTSFVLGGGFIMPLCRLALRCRHPSTRRAAIHILRGARRRDGQLEGMLAARVLERIVDAEEDGLGENTESRDVPEAARVAGVLVKFLSGKRRAKLTYSRAAGPNGVRALVEEELSGGSHFWGD